MPLIYSSQQENTNERTNTRRLLPRTFSRYNLDVHHELRYENSSVVRSLLQQRRQVEYNNTATNSSRNSSRNSSDSSSISSNSSSDSSIIEEEEEEEEEGDGIIRTLSNNNSSDIEEEEDDDDDNTTITESFTRSRVDIYRLAIRTNSEILEDLAAIIRILRQINAIYRVFHNTNNSNRHYNRRPTTTIRRRRRPILLHYNNNNDDDDNIYINHHSDTEEEEEDDDDEANKLLEAGLEDLQTVLTMENNGGIKRQSTLALLALITYQYNHCSDKYLRHYLDPNGDYNPALAIFAAATYDEEESTFDQSPKSCKDIIIAAEELYGPDWLDEFHKGKEGALRKMLEKLTFVAQIRLKVRETSILTVIR